MSPFLILFCHATDWLQLNAGWIAALATVIRAIFTYRLAQATTKLIPRSPKLSIEYDQSEPFVRAHPGQRWVRIQIANTGKGTAKNYEVKAQFTKWEPTPSEILSGEKIAPDESLLHWVRRAIDINWYQPGRDPMSTERYFDSIPEGTRSVDIRPEERELADLVFAPMGRINLRSSSEEEQSTDKKRAQLYTHRWLYLRKGIDRLPPGNYEAHITVYSENSQPQSKDFRVTYRGNDDLTVALIGAVKST